MKDIGEVQCFSWAEHQEKPSGRCHQIQNKDLHVPRSCPKCYGSSGNRAKCRKKCTAISTKGLNAVLEVVSDLNPSGTDLVSCRSTRSSMWRRSCSVSGWQTVECRPSAISMDTQQKLLNFTFYRRNSRRSSTRNWLGARYSVFFPASPYPTEADQTTVSANRGSNSGPDSERTSCSEIWQVANDARIGQLRRDVEVQ